MRCLLSLLVALVASGCSQPQSIDDLRRFVAEARSLPAARLDPLPEPVHYRPVAYAADDRRSPFGRVAADDHAPATPVPPDPDDAPDGLQGVALASLTLVGTLSGLSGAGSLALVRDASGAVHRVKLGDRLGLQRGRVSAIGPQQLVVRELVADEAGQWVEQRRTLVLPGASSE